MHAPKPTTSPISGTGTRASSTRSSGCAAVPKPPCGVQRAELADGVRTLSTSFEDGFRHRLIPQAGNLRRQICRDHTKAGGPSAEPQHLVEERPVGREIECIPDCNSLNRCNAGHDAVEGALLICRHLHRERHTGVGRPCHLTTRRIRSSEPSR